jgi:hypothetical protein
LFVKLVWAKAHGTIARTAIKNRAKKGRRKIMVMVGAALAA